MRRNRRSSYEILCWVVSEGRIDKPKIELGYTRRIMNKSVEGRQVCWWLVCDRVEKLGYWLGREGVNPRKRRNRSKTRWENDCEPKGLKSGKIRENGPEEGKEYGERERWWYSSKKGKSWEQIMVEWRENDWDKDGGQGLWNKIRKRINGLRWALVLKIKFGQ